MQLDVKIVTFDKWITRLKERIQDDGLFQLVHATVEGCTDSGCFNSFSTQQVDTIRSTTGDLLLT